MREIILTSILLELDNGKIRELLHPMEMLKTKVTLVDFQCMIHSTLTEREFVVAVMLLYCGRAPYTHTHTH